MRVEPADSLSLSVDGPFATAIDKSDDNLVLRAARLLADHARKAHGARITLTKNLPVASGIGGGSADAAATLRALRLLWSLEIRDDAMASLGLSLGADVPVCLFGRTARVQGIGERITPAADLPDVGLVLVNPGVSVATGDAFHRWSGTFSSAATLPACFSDVAALMEALDGCRNDLAPAARSLAPAIDAVLDAIAATPGCLMARLSGSGATCFGLFPDIEGARLAAAGIQSENRSWWTHTGRFLTETPSVRQEG